jgi:hypothetical protein
METRFTEASQPRLSLVLPPWALAGTLPCRPNSHSTPASASPLTEVTIDDVYRNSVLTYEDEAHDAVPPDPRDQIQETKDTYNRTTQI